MEQTILAKQESPLLTYAISKLNPDIFSHPIWVRFGRRAGPIQSEVVQNILDHAEELKRDNPVDACQLMFICAAYQSHANQWDYALTTIENILDLATQAGLPTELHCAYWGACAVCFQQQKYDQAASLLNELEVALTQQNEWVLSNFVNVIKQTLCQPEMVSEWKQPDMSDGLSSNDLSHFTFLWLQKWGLSFQVPKPEKQTKLGPWYAQDFFHKWRRKWNGSNKGGRQLSVWQSIRSLLRLQEDGQKHEPQAELKSIQRHTETVLESAMEETRAQFTPPKGENTTLIDEALISNSKSGLANDAVPVNHLAMDETAHIPVVVHMLGALDLMIGEKSVKLPGSRGLSLLKYLLFQHKQNTSREVLMDIFWPDAEPETARNNLNVAIHSLRTALRPVIFLPVIIFEDGAYGIAPDFQVWLDVEEFEKYVKSGQQLESRKQLAKAIAEYETAITLYQGDFLADTPYESWTVLERERLRISYIDTVDHLSQIYFTQERYAACVALCQLILTRDSCREDVHCRLMQCFSRLGQGPLALRQYQICEQALRTELDVEPEPVTAQLAERIRRHERV